MTDYQFEKLCYLIKRSAAFILAAILLAASSIVFALHHSMSGDVFVFNIIGDGVFFYALLIRKPQPKPEGTALGEALSKSLRVEPPK